MPLNVSEQGPGRFLVAGAATVIAAALSWTFFEKPLNGFKRYFPYVARPRAHMAGDARWTSPTASSPALELRRTEARR
jgi:peptidoglycan/LPS O-acetylase OafA/YrhL